MIKAAGIILKILSTVMVCTVVILAVLLAGLRLFGFTPYIVLSGSMEPAYHVGSVVYVVDADPSELKAGDPLTYRMTSGAIVTHRIIEVINNEDGSAPSFVTKGDANDIPDGAAVPASAVIGTPRFTIPYLGYISDFIKKPAGIIAVISSCAAVLILSVVVESISQKDKPDDTDDDENKEKETSQG